VDGLAVDFVGDVLGGEHFFEDFLRGQFFGFEQDLLVEADAGLRESFGVVLEGEARLRFQGFHERFEWGGCLECEDRHSAADHSLIGARVFLAAFRKDQFFDAFDLLNRTDDGNSATGDLMFDSWQPSFQFSQNALLGASLKCELSFDARVDRHVDDADSVSVVRPFETQVELSEHCQQQLTRRS